MVVQDEKEALIKQDEDEDDSQRQIPNPPIQKDSSPFKNPCKYDGTYE